jgi:hypothetical protein
MKISIAFDCDNDAFSEAGDVIHSAGLEVARILRDIADEVWDDGFAETSRAIFDLNGNKIGNWTVSP